MDISDDHRYRSVYYDLYDHSRGRETFLNHVDHFELCYPFNKDDTESYNAR